ncbi:NADH-quinone oxidoreductase subunit C [Fodinicurvata halophila]|uniref:NADH-quinone oxidoreductase subunit C n=1 Tax=Fodinicurvata halophila TaxID=1419723 RepID=A0ABV8UHU5_9PROT
MNPTLKDLSEHLTSSLPGDIFETETVCDELIIWTYRESLLKVMTVLRDDPNAQFKQLMDVTAVDYPDRPERFEVVYNLLSLKHNLRIRVKVPAAEDTPVPTVCEIYSSAIWFEREVWDLFGVFFSDHPDLRRIMTDYGFEGHPLRKDFPLTGYVEVRYDEDQKRVVYEPVNLVQEFRNFDFVSPWEGMLHLPGDEKADADDATQESKA